ncbi:hypothetical protein MSAN_01973100 [Mycena sanguinolenta]|uniref:Uncharacterized protein n=1 Tax=Mycena sanguinolenta TaxID=230812 RepID=A0A8H7CPH5_9AGAR|nr:hypothetical protein MSAN_01973100 [Mycena sanguinolenta]
MRLVLYFRFFGVFAALSLVSGQLNVTLDDNDPSINYSDGWNVSTTNNPLDFGGTLHFSVNSTASASVTFRGVAVYLLSPGWSSSVGAQVILDGQGPFVIDFEDYGVGKEPGLGRETLRSQIVWGATELSDTDHTMTISMPSGVQYVVLDGLIYSTLEENGAESVAPSPESSTPSVPTPTATPTNQIISSSSSSEFSFTQPTATTSSSSSASSSSNLLNSSADTPTSQHTNLPVNVGSAPSPSNSAAAAGTSVDAVSTPNAKRIVVIASIVAAIILVSVFVLLACRRRRRRRIRQQPYTWSQKFVQPTPHAGRMASKRPPPPVVSPFVYEHPRSPLPSPSSAIGAPLLSPVAPAALRIPRSPLGTAPPIMPPPTPSSVSQSHAAELHFPMPPAIHAGYSAPLSPAPTTPLPLTPLPPATPGTPWTTTKSHRLSGSSVYSYDSLMDSNIGYGWTTPSLVGIHPFSASAPGEQNPAASSSKPSIGVNNAAAARLAPKMNEKAAEALLQSRPQDNEQRMSAAPAYREKDVARLFVGERPRAGTQSSEVAPPVYEP